MSNKFAPSWRVQFEVMSALENATLSTTAICYSCTFKRETVTKAITYMLRKDLIRVDTARTKYDEAFYKLSDEGKEKLSEYREKDKQNRKIIESVVHEAVLCPDFTIEIGGKYHVLKRHARFSTEEWENIGLGGYDRETKSYKTGVEGLRLCVGQKIKVRQTEISDIIGSSKSLEKYLDKREKESLVNAHKETEKLQERLRKAREEVFQLKEEVARLTKERDALHEAYELQFKEKPNLG